MNSIHAKTKQRFSDSGAQQKTHHSGMKFGITGNIVDRVVENILNSDEVFMASQRDRRPNVYSLSALNHSERTESDR